MINFSYQDSKEVEHLLDRSIKMQINIEDGDVMVSVGESVVYMTLIEWKDTDN